MFLGCGINLAKTFDMHKIILSNQKKGVYMKENKALQGQLKLHWEKVELIRSFNPLLADEITEFTNQLIDCDFKGVFTVKDEVYHNGIGISQSRFSYLKKSPNFYFHKTYKSIQSNLNRPRHFQEGDFIHRIILEKKTVANLFVSEAPILRLAWEAKPESKNIRATKEYKQGVANARLDGKDVIRDELFEEIHILEDYIQEEPILKNILDNGIPEKAMYCICKETGLIRKGKADFIMPADGDKLSLLDVKSSRNIEPDKFEWSVYNYGYHTQGAYYTDLLSDATGKEIKDYMLLTIEKESPFECDLGFFDGPTLEAGRTGSKNGYMKFLSILAECYKAELFPRNKLEVKAYGIPTSKMNDELIQLT